MKLANKPTSPAKISGKETQSQSHIRQLRQQINEQNQDTIRPFTGYKIITYLCTLFFPLVPVALYRIWCSKTEFSRQEQIIWTGVIMIIAAYVLIL